MYIFLKYFSFRFILAWGKHYWETWKGLAFVSRS